MSCKGSCWDRFERKTLLTFTGYRERAATIMREIDRIGMRGVNVQWQFPNPFDKVLIRQLKHIPCLERGGYMNLTLGHYAAIKTAFHLGCGNCLIMEDDIRFLKDCGEIERTVSSLPDDYDVALFDLMPIDMKDCGPDDVIRLRTERSRNGRWAEFYNMRSMGCYALSRRAMERLIWLNEAVVTSPEVGKMRICDHFLNRKYLGDQMRLYFAKTNVAVQRQMGAANSAIDEYQVRYRRMGLDLSQYAE